MHRRLIQRLLTLGFLVFFSLPAFGQYTRDKAARKKIDEAVNQHYLATDFDKAEGVLLGTVKACEDKCSPQTLARAWMYVGIIRGSGRSDQAGAQEAFAKAVALDPSVALDEALATPETKETFAAAGGTAGGGGPAPVPAEEAAAGTDDGDIPADVAGTMDCTPGPQQVETRRPIPIECRSGEDPAQIEVRYKGFGSSSWHSVMLRKSGDGYRGEIPCDATRISGDLLWYARAKDSEGDVVDNFGTKNEPASFEIVTATSEPPPAFPGEEPPARCADTADCPPDFPGCGNDEPAGAVCDTDSDCATGSCVDGVCEAAQEEDKGYKKIWVGVHVAQDFLFFPSGTDVCDPGSDYSCFEAGTITPYPKPDINELPLPGTDVNGGTVAGTTRFMGSFDYAFTPNITGGVRVGFAIGGPPENFLPIHGELRGTYFFRGLDKIGFRPYVHLGGGVAEVAGKVPATVRTCIEPDPALGDELPSNAGQCQEGTEELEVDVYRNTGRPFVTAGGGLVYAFSKSFGLQLNLNAMLMFGASGFALQPSGGVVLGL